MSPYPTSPAGGGSPVSPGLSGGGGEFRHLMQQPFRPSDPGVHRQSPLRQEFPHLADEPFKPKGPRGAPRPSPIPKVPLRPRNFKHPLVGILGLLLENPVIPFSYKKGGDEAPYDWVGNGWTLTVACPNAGAPGGPYAHDVLSVTNVSIAFNCGIFRFGTPTAADAVGQPTATSAETWHRITPGSPFPYSLFPGEDASIDQWGRAPGYTDIPSVTVQTPPVIDWHPVPEPERPGDWLPDKPPKPLPYPLLPRPDTPDRQTGPKPDEETNPGAKPRPQLPPQQFHPPAGKPPPPHKPTRPGPGVKERKFKFVPGLAEDIIGPISEWGDFIDALYDALPCHVKGGKMIATPPPFPGAEPGSYCAFVPKRGLQDKMELLYENWETVDIDQAVFNFLANQVEDAAIGKLGSKLKDAVKDNPFWVSPKGIGFGPVL